MPDSQRVDLDDLALHYWEWSGDPPAIVCLHPSSHYGREWLAATPDRVAVSAGAQA